MNPNYYTLSIEGILTIHEGVKKIPLNGFKNREDITKVIFPVSLFVIGKDAFYGCINLQEIETKPNLKVIEQGAFQNCFKLRLFEIPKNVYNDL